MPEEILITVLIIRVLPNMGAALKRPLSIVVILKSHAADGNMKPMLVILKATFIKIILQTAITLRLNLPNPVDRCQESMVDMDCYFYIDDFLCKLKVKNSN